LKVRSTRYSPFGDIGEEGTPGLNSINTMNSPRTWGRWPRYSALCFPRSPQSLSACGRQEAQGSFLPRPTRLRDRAIVASATDKAAEAQTW